MRLQFSQRTTVSGDAAFTSLNSVMSSSRRQPSQRRWLSRAAPMPPAFSRSRSYSLSRSAGIEPATTARSLPTVAASPSSSPKAESRRPVASSIFDWTEETRPVSSPTRSCADSRRSMTSRTTSSRSPWRLASEAISRWRLSRSLGEVTAPESRRCWSRAARWRTWSTSCSALVCSRAQSLSSVVEATSRSRSCERSLVSDSISACSGSDFLLCASCCRRTSRAWTSSSRIWSAGAAFSWGLQRIEKGRTPRGRSRGR